MIEQHQARWRRYGVAAIAIVATFFVGGVLIHWSWNTVAHDLFQAPVMKFRHAIAVEILVAVLAGISTFASRMANRRQARS